MSRFEVVTFVNAPPEVVFVCSTDVGVHAASMADSSEQAVAGVMTGRMSLGDQVTWRARHFGIWWRMTSRIVVFDPPQRFVDEQIAGPFAHWHHEHRFEASGREGTVMRDVVDFAAPFGLAGKIVEAVLLAGYMARLIEQRNRHLAAAAERQERE
jgi:ligand-binding SRPBCC domain-containing protein